MIREHREFAMACLALDTKSIDKSGSVGLFKYEDTSRASPDSGSQLERRLVPLTNLAMLSSCMSATGSETASGGRVASLQHTKFTVAVEGQSCCITSSTDATGRCCAQNGSAISNVSKASQVSWKFNVSIGPPADILI